MAILKLRSGTPIEAKKGRVEIHEGCVVLYDDKGMVIAYHLQPGDIVRRTSEGEYIVEF